MDPAQEIPGDPRRDEVLVDAVNAGDGDAFGVLYRRHKAWAFRIAYRFTSDAEAAADLVQEAFLSVLARFPGFRLTSRLTTYLYPIIRRAALNRARRARPLAFGAANEAENGPQADEDAAMAPMPTTLNPRLAAAMDGLSPAHREVLMMHAVDEMSHEEIALSLGVPIGTVKSRLYHAILAVRERYGA